MMQWKTETDVVEYGRIIAGKWSQEHYFIHIIRDLIVYIQVKEVGSFNIGKQREFQSASISYDYVSKSSFRGWEEKKGIGGGKRKCEILLIIIKSIGNINKSL